MAISYIDTNLLVAYYCDEPLSKIVDIILRDLELRVISNLSIIEFYSALSKKTRCDHIAKAQLDSKSAIKIRKLFNAHVKQGHFKKITLVNKHYALAQSYLSKFNTPLRTYDALHLAVAANENIHILTTDQNLFKSAKKLKKKIKFLDERIRKIL